MTQINLILRFGLNAGADLWQILRVALYYVVSILIQVMLTMCTAYLATTVSATLLQNRKGFLRVLISITLFILLSWLCGWTAGKLLYNRIDVNATVEQLMGIIGWAALFDLAFSAVYIAASGWLLEKKVNL